MGMKRDLKVAERRRDVATMYLAGYKQVEIAVKWRVSQPQISYDLKWIHAEWVSAASAGMGEIKARELARIDALELEYWQAWRDSKREKVRGGQTKRETGRRASTETRIDKETREGDPRYLVGVQWCVEQRLKIFGAYMPQKFEAEIKDWRSKLIDAIREQKLDYPTIADELGTDLATELFRAAGATIGPRREIAPASQLEKLDADSPHPSRPPD